MMRRPIQCALCEHFRSPLDVGDGTGGPTCSAFPLAIPEPIWLGDADHREPYPGDGGIRWSALDGAKFPEYALSVEEKAFVPTEPDRVFLEQMRAKHLPGRHDQSTHGRRKPKTLTPDSAALLQERMLKGRPWSDANREAFGDWSGNGYADINDILRRPDAYGPVKTEFLTGQIRGIRDGMRPLPQAVRVYRAVDSSRFELGDNPEALVGKRLQNAGFTATTVGERDDIPDVDPGETEYDAILEIDVPKGVGAAYLESVTANEGEHELLLDAGLILEFTGATRQGPWPVIQARVVQA